MKLVAALITARRIAFLLLLVAVAGLGAADRNAPAPGGTDLAAYLLSGGTLDEICAGTGAPGGAHDLSCAACVLAGKALVPDAGSGGMRLAARIVTRAVESKRIAAWHSPLDLARASRAPPVI